MMYLAQVINSTLREITPILLVALCAGVCSKVQVFNIALEGTLLMSAFFAFLTHYFLQNIFLSVAVAMIVAMGMTLIMSTFVVRLKGQPMIVGMALNTFARGFTTFLLSVIFKTKGAVNPSDLKGLTKFDLPVIRDIPFLSTVFGSLTVIDYLAFALAVVMFVIMYRTVIGFRLRALGINRSAASSLGVNVARYQILATTLSGKNVEAKIMARVEQIKPEMALNCKRWNWKKDVWKRYVESMIDYARKRPAWLIQDICKTFKLSESEKELYFGDALEMLS